MKKTRALLLSMLAVIGVIGAMAPPASAAIYPLDNYLATTYVQTYPGTIYNQCGWRSAITKYDSNHNTIEVTSYNSYSTGPGCADTVNYLPATQIYQNMQMQVRNKVTGAWTNWGSLYTNNNPTAARNIGIIWDYYNTPALPEGYAWRIVLGWSIYTALGWQQSFVVGSEFAST